MASNKKFIALAGNPNAGKTTVFNWYTGARQSVGNYPGVTVEKKDGTVTIDGESIHLTDLPGIYSLTAYSMEEVVARRVLTEESPDAVLNIVNTSVLERNLYLTIQMRELGIPIVLALNMMDEAKAQGIEVNVAKLEELTGIQALPTVARTGEGLNDALLAATKASSRSWSPLEISYGADIDNSLLNMIPIIKKESALTDKYPARWLALKMLESDQDIQDQIRKVAPDAYNQLKEITEHLASHLKTTLNTYPEGVIADYRYGYISSILRQVVTARAEDLQTRIAKSDKIDRILTNSLFGPLFLLGLLYVMYFVTFELGAYPEELLGSVFEALGGFVNANMNDGYLKSLITSGIIDGVGGVLGFVPLIMIMFLFISILEDSGYMARVAYMMDRVFRIFGLHGASIMPFIISGGIGGGCAIPGIMAARTLRSPRERLATILTAPFMACGAKLPVFLLFVGVFFKQNQALIMFIITLAGWFFALLTAKILRSTIIRGEATPFIMELPPYRMPTISGVLIHTWERAWMYIKKAGTIILAISILIWAGMSFPELSSEQAEIFTTQREILTVQLNETPAHALASQIAHLEQTAEAGATTPILAELDALQKLYAELPFVILTNEKEELSAQLEAAEHDENEELIGRLEEQLSTLEERIEELPEGNLLAQISEVDNNEASATLRNSFAGRLGVMLEGVSKPAGFDWRTNIAVVGGIAAKEVVVSTLGTAYSLGEIDDEDSDSTLSKRIAADPGWTTANAVAIILFTLLYSPCFPALVVIKQEAGGWRWLFFSLFFNLALAYSVAVAANQLISHFY